MSTSVRKTASGDGSDSKSSCDTRSRSSRQSSTSGRLCESKIASARHEVSRQQRDVADVAVGREVVAELHREQFGELVEDRIFGIRGGRRPVVEALEDGGSRAERQNVVAELAVEGGDIERGIRMPLQEGHDREVLHRFKRNGERRVGRREGDLRR
jgi:hypothetical protein